MKPIRENLTQRQIDDNGLGPRLQAGDDWQPQPYVDFTPSVKFEAWLAEVAKLLGVTVPFDVPLDKAAHDDLRRDESWYWCYDDRYSPEKAVAEYHACQTGGRRG